MKDVGLTENRISLLWDSAHPTTIDGQANLAAAIHDAQADGVRITLDIYPTRAKALTDSPVAPGKFAAFTALVARTFPTVKDFIIGNEPNKSRFWQPQFNRNGTRAACSGYEPAARSVLRRAEVGRPLDHRGRRRSRPARHGQPARAREPLDLPGPLPRATSGAPTAAASGRSRSWTRSATTRTRARPRTRSTPATRGRTRDPGPRAHQAGRLGRVPRHRAADVSGGRDAERAGAHAQAAAERGRLAGLDSAGEPRRVLRQRERRHDRRRDAGGDLREPDSAAGLRPVRRSRSSSSTSSTRRTSIAGSRG